MSRNKKTALVWFTNDLRTKDNAILNQAILENDRVISVYIFDDTLCKLGDYGFQKTAAHRIQFNIESVKDLKVQLLDLNISILTYVGKAELIIPNLVEKFHISCVYKQTEWTRDEIATLNKVQLKVASSVKLKTAYNQFLYHPDDINFQIEDVPDVFTVFRKNIEKNLSVRPTTKAYKLEESNLVQNPTQIPHLEQLGYQKIPIPKHTAFPFQGGTTTAEERIHKYFFESQKLGVYKKTRNGLLGIDYSSKLSPWLANGSISAPMIYWEVKKFEKLFYKNQSTYWLIFELIWRDFFKYISLKYQNKIYLLSGIKEVHYDWSNNQQMIKDWINGSTSEPFINANMIELKQTGWMSNRGRQNTASFFAKTMKLDWRIGAAYFESMLLDYDTHSNYGNWMYVSGVGNDPRDRVFDTMWQAQRYDPKSKYQLLWLQKKLF